MTGPSSRPSRAAGAGPSGSASSAGSGRPERFWLTTVDGRTLAARSVPVVVVGAGVAGLSSALGIDDDGQRCVVVSEGAVGRAGSSPLAQGGVAAAVGPDDSPAAHADDTLRVSAGLADAEMARILTESGPQVIRSLVELGTAFDRTADGALALGREAGHGERRIVHANGDATGAAIMATLTAAVRSRSGIELMEHTRAVDLIRGGPDGRRVVGLVVIGADGEPQALLAPAVILATGGYGHCFARTTTPADVIGSGIAMAARAGATVADMELVQFHPTALDVDDGDRLPLLTEALRGEGAILVDETGRRYMVGEHPDAELAPRDVVARASYRLLVAGHRPYLDARAAVGDAFPQRFPTVFALATAHGLDPRTDLLPVTPAAHYCMGGVAVDGQGRTSLAGLWAAGEVTSSGLHGGNRLASNSLLEGLVMGRRVAADVIATGVAADGPLASRSLWLPDDLDTVLAGTAMTATPMAGTAVTGTAVTGRSAADGAVAVVGADAGADAGVVDQVRRILWDGAGVVRNAAGMAAALAALDRLGFAARSDMTARTAHTVARLVLTSALARTESRGAHHRSDHPDLDPGQASRRLMPQVAVTAERWSPVLVAVALAS